MGIILKRNGRVEEAIDSYKKAISLKPDYVQAYNNLGVLYKDEEDYENAIKMFTKAKEIQPNHQSSYYNLYLIKKEQGLLNSFQLDKDQVLNKIDAATYHQLQGNIEKANKIYTDLSIEHPENAEILYRKSGFALQLEKFKEAWICYEYRWQVFPMNRTTRSIEGKPLWKGERGKRVSVWKEQGIGDDIIFLSLIPEVKEMCASLSVYVDPRLQSLCRRAMPEINFVEDVEELQNEECDYHLPLGSVPGLLRNDISDFDRTVTGYLKADPKRVASIRDELKLDGKTVIGISWKSSNLEYLIKSIQLQDMEQMFTGLDVVLINLQYGDVDDEIREFKEATGIDVVQCASVDNREDLDGLAALIEACDIVISTSNVTVHLAGALAKETWVLLSYVMVNFWWLLERTDSVWYPSLTLYRQPTLNDWDSVYVSIRKDLERKLTKI